MTTTKFDLECLRAFTERTHEHVMELTCAYSRAESRSERIGLETAIRDAFGDWEDEVARIGGMACGMWIVELETPEGYFRWRYPDSQIRRTTFCSGGQKES